MHIFSTTQFVMLVTLLATASAVCNPKRQESGILNLTEEQFEDFYCENTIGLLVAKSDQNKREYRAIQTISIDQKIEPVEVPCWALFHQYLATYKPLFQIWANKNCRDYRSCWCCPDGSLCVAFVIKPNSLPCFKWANPVYQKNLTVFEVRRKHFSSLQ